MTTAKEARQASSRRRARVLPLLPVFIVLLAFSVRSVGAVPTAFVTCVGAAVVVGTIWLLSSLDRRRKARFATVEGALWHADATVRGKELAAFLPAGVQLRPEALLAGKLEVTDEAWSWTPRTRNRRPIRLAKILTPWSQVSGIESAHLRSLIPCDAVSFSLADGRQFTLYVTNPEPVYKALASLGIPVRNG